MGRKKMIVSEISFFPCLISSTVTPLLHVLLTIQPHSSKVCLVLGPNRLSPYYCCIHPFMITATRFYWMSINAPGNRKISNTLSLSSRNFYLGYKCNSWAFILQLKYYNVRKKQLHSPLFILRIMCSWRHLSLAWKSLHLAAATLWESGTNLSRNSM